MMFSKDDFKLPESGELIEFLPFFVFIAFVAPFLLAAYTVGFVLDITGMLREEG